MDLRSIGFEVLVTLVVASFILRLFGLPWTRSIAVSLGLAIIQASLQLILYPVVTALPDGIPRAFVTAAPFALVVVLVGFVGRTYGRDSA